MDLKSLSINNFFYFAVYVFFVHLLPSPIIQRSHIIILLLKESTVEYIDVATECIVVIKALTPFSLKT